MNEIEDRLRAAFRADAETVSAQTLRPFAGRDKPGLMDIQLTNALRPPDETRRRTGPGRVTSSRRVLVPVTAAAAIAVVAVTTIVLPRAHSDQTGSSHGLRAALASGYQRGVMPAAAPPKFFVAITNNPDVNTTSLQVVSSATGRVVGRLGRPAPHRYFQAVTALGNNSTFVAEASGLRCDTWFYQFKLNSQGQPIDLIPLVVPEVPGRPITPFQPDPAPLAASADGNIVAYSAARCSSASTRRSDGQVGVINLATAKVTTWQYRFPAAPYSLSLTADGRLLELVSNPSDGSHIGGDQKNATWVVHTDSPAGELAQRYHRVFGAPVPPTAAVLSPTGAITFAVTPVRTRDRRSEPLRAYRTASGHLIRQLLIFTGIKQGPSLNADVSGRYLLAFFLTDRVEWVDLATGRLTNVPRFGGNLQDLAW